MHSKYLKLLPIDLHELLIHLSIILSCLIHLHEGLIHKIHLNINLSCLIDFKIKNKEFIILVVVETHQLNSTYKGIQISPFSSDISGLNKFNSFLSIDN